MAETLQTMLTTSSPGPCRITSATNWNSNGKPFATAPPDKKHDRTAGPASGTLSLIHLTLMRSQISEIPTISKVRQSGTHYYCLLKLTGPIVENTTGIGVTEYNQCRLLSEQDTTAPSAIKVKRPPAFLYLSFDHGQGKKPYQSFTPTKEDY